MHGESRLCCVHSALSLNIIQQTKYKKALLPQTKYARALLQNHSQLLKFQPFCDNLKKNLLWLECLEFAKNVLQLIALRALCFCSQDLSTFKLKVIQRITVSANTVSMWHHFCNVYSVTFKYLRHDHLRDSHKITKIVLDSRKKDG